MPTSSCWTRICSRSHRPKSGRHAFLLTVLDGKVVFDGSEDPADMNSVEEAHGVELDFEEGGSGSPHGQFAVE